MVQSCCNALGDEEGARRAARMTLERAEKAVAQGSEQRLGDRHSAVDRSCNLGRDQAGAEWIDRALLIDPDT